MEPWPTIATAIIVGIFAFVQGYIAARKRCMRMHMVVHEGFVNAIYTQGYEDGQSGNNSRVTNSRAL